MSAREEKQGMNVYLFFYTEEVCFREIKNFSLQEELWLEIDEKKLHTMKPLKFTMKRLPYGWCILGKEMAQGNYCFLKTEAGEQVLLVVGIVNDMLVPCSRIALDCGERITVGTDFFNDVFYECGMFVKGMAFSIRKDKNGIWLKNEAPQVGLKKRNAVYVNGKSVLDKIKLHAGDNVVFWGMNILVLPVMLLCVSHYGVMRIAKQNDVLSLKEKERKRIIVKKSETIETMVADEKSIHRQEVEIEAPQAEIRQMQPPFILALGPTITMILPVLFMVSASSTISGNAGYYQMTISMTIASTLLSVFWGMINFFYRKYKNQREEQKRQKSYREYLRQTERYLKKCKEENRIAMLMNHPSATEIMGEGAGKMFRNREKGRDNVWFIRLGIGEIPFQMNIKLPGGSRELCRDYLLREAYEMADCYRCLEGVPVGINLQTVSSIGYIGKNVCNLVLQSLVQLIAGCDGRSMKLLYFYHEEYQQEQCLSQCLKWLPHIWSAGKEIRFLAGNEKEAGEVLPYITKLLESDKEKDFGTWYVFIIANQQLIKGESIGQFLGKECKSNIRMIYMGAEIEEIPVNCCCFVWQKENKVKWYENESIKEQDLDLDECDVKQADEYMRQLADVKWIGSSEEIKKNISFLDLYGCDRVEELNCSFRWRENRTKERMRVPIGKGEGEKTVYLDIHEKFHGPHGLVAGTTGSGKSELLQTYLLSLAVSFSPEDINFFIIDYKGGGMGDMLAILPHCSGVISNLSGRQIGRALAAIKSENIRRQECFRKEGVSHVEEYKELYYEGKVTKPMPHLIIVVDEFAELKKEEPEFMQEMISVSQVGRSLGVHLILATQKPAGCVDDRIWSNTRFRLCLRVADKQDSIDMLHRPEAVGLPGTGRGYLQVGNNEIFTEFQAGYCKAAYQMITDKNNTVLVTNTGRRIKATERKAERGPAQIKCIIDYINSAAENSNYEKVEKLWMPQLPKVMKLIPEYSNGNDEICLGIRDDVWKREQSPIYYNPVKDGHVCLCGGPATGKSTFLQTVLWQLCKQYSSDEVQILLAASDYAGVNCFEQMPHCIGNMRTAEDAECFFYHLENLFYQRKTLLEGINYVQYQKKQSIRIPQLFLVIDNYGSFRHMTEDKYALMIEKIACEGINYGIYLVVTALGTGSGEIPAKLFEKIKTTLALEMSDKVAYGDILRRYQITVLPTENCKGRGLCKQEERILEFQVPLIGSEDDYERICMIEDECSLQQMQVHSPKKFPQIPKDGNFEMLWKQFKREDEKGDAVPIGYLAKTGEICGLALKDLPFVITGGGKSGKKSLFKMLLKGVYRQGASVFLYDARKEIDGEDMDFATTVTAEQIRKDILFTGDMPILGVCNLADFIKEVPHTDTLPPMIVISRPEEEIQLLGEVWYERLTSHQWGICMGGNAGNQRMLRFDDLSYEEISRAKPPGYGYLKTGIGAKTERIKLVAD